MVWVDIGNPNVVSFKEPWMDEPVEVTSTGKVNVEEEVADRLVNEREDADYASSVDEEEDEQNTDDTTETEDEVTDGEE